MFRQIHFRVFWIGCFSSMFLLLSAQSKLDSLHHLHEVVITAKINKEVIPVQSLSGDKLEKLAVHSVADAIRYFSGVQIKDYGGIGGLKTVNIRSMGTNHVGVFYDGIELGNAQNGVIDLGRFSLDNMEAVTLYNGQKSAIFQPAKDFGSAGSIYLQSRTPVFQANKAYHVKAAFKTGSFGVVNPSLLWEQKLSENVSASLSTEYMYTTGKYKFTYAVAGGYDTTAVRRNGDVNALRTEGGLYGKIKGGYWRTKAYFYNSETSTALNDYNGSYCTVDDKVAVSKNFTPSYDSSKWDDFKLFIPDDELHLSPGDWKLYFNVRISDDSKNKTLCNSDKHGFSFNKAY